MELTYLGHASWLVRAGALRLLFDPILDDPHQGGTYAVWPPRRIVAEALRADFLFVSHAHGDHFDVRSLARLATLDPDTAVVTPDALVAHVAARVGFRTVREVPAGQALALDGARVVLTPSHAPDPEWGAIVETEDASAWNQVDAVLASPEEVRGVLAAARLQRPLDLAMVRWAPLLEIDAQVPGSLAFPFAQHRELLDQIAATGARAIVPAAAGQRHLGVAAWLDTITMPVTEGRFLEDISVRMPNTKALPGRLGATYRVGPGGTELIEVDTPDLLVPVGDAETDPRGFRPLSIEAVRDLRADREEGPLRRRLETWVRQDLAAALQAAWPTFRSASPVRLGLEIVFPSGPERWTLFAKDGATVVRLGLADDLDVLDVVTASGLADVLDGRRAWGHVLLAGELRASERAYRVRAEDGLYRLPVAAMFLYYALPYAESSRRATLAELDAVLAGQPPPWAVATDRER